MSIESRSDDFTVRRSHLQQMSDDHLHRYFWSLVDQLAAPLIEEARTHTSPSIERSVLLRMGFSSVEAKALVDAFHDRAMLQHGAGHLVLQLAKARGVSVREAGEALMAGRLWNEVRP